MHMSIKKDLEKAENLAYWSFIGIVFPLVGFILGFLSAYKLKDVDESKLNAKTRERADKVLSMTYISRGVSVIMMIVSFVLFAYMYQETNKQVQQANEIYQQELNKIYRNATY